VLYSPRYTHWRGYWRCTRSPHGRARCRQPMVVRAVCRCLSLSISSAFKSLSLSLPLSPPSPGSALWRLVARVFYQSLFFFLIFFFLVYTHYYYYCILGKRPREERGSRGTTSRRLRASSRTGPARVNNNKTKRGLVCTPTHAHDRDKGHPNDIYAANK